MFLRNGNIFMVYTCLVNFTCMVMVIEALFLVHVQINIGNLVCPYDLATAQQINPAEWITLWNIHTHHKWN